MFVSERPEFRLPRPHVEKIGVEIKLDLKPMAETPAQIQLKSQDNKGAFYFDNAAGQLQGSEVNQKMQMSVSVQGREATQDVESSVRMEQTRPETGRPEAKKATEKAD